MKTRESPITIQLGEPMLFDVTNKTTVELFKELLGKQDALRAEAIKHELGTSERRNLMAQLGYFNPAIDILVASNGITQNPLCDEEVMETIRNYYVKAYPEKR